MATIAMPFPLRPLLACLITVCVLLPPTAVAQDKSAERAARRAQLQMQNMQQQVQDAQAAQARADADKAEAEKKLSAQAQEIPRAQAAAHQAATALKAGETARLELQARVVALEKQLAEQKRGGDAALDARSAELAYVMHAWDASQAQMKSRYDNEVAQVEVCTGRNHKLIELGAELLNRYRKKGLAEVVGQRDPLLGLGQVEMFNLVQDYRDRVDEQRLTPTPPGQKPQP